MSGMDAVRAILRDELLQVMATGVVALSLLGIQVALDNVYLPALLQATYEVPPTPLPGSMMEAANGKISSLAGTTNSVLADMSRTSIDIGREASKGVFCNFLGVGYTLVNCSPLNAFRGSLTAAAFTTSVALADTFAQQFLLSLAANYAFSLIIPLGLFLRCFKISRAAGGALIAFGFGFYTVYPAVIMSTENLLHGTSTSVPSDIPSPKTCDPMESEVAVSLQQFNDYSGQITDFDLTESIAYFVLVRVLFLSILNLIITLGFIRALAHVIGSDIDISALARIS